MTDTKLSAKKLSTLTAAIAAGTAVPQFVDAAIVTVGGDGGTGSVTLSSPGQTTDLGGVLDVSILYRTVVFPSNLSFSLLGTNSDVRLFDAFRSSVVGTSTTAGNFWEFASDSSPTGNADFNSDDNWVPGEFSVNGVNSENPIWGWLQVQLGGSPGNYDPTIISFTYDDAATDTSPFQKPIGGFSVSSDSAVPEPSSFALTALALGAAGVAALRRRRKDEANVESPDA